MEIIGHRGASWDAPENTVASVRLAFEQGADGAEIDVRLTGDGHIVAFHDETTRRTGGGRDVPVLAQTLDELRRCDAGGWKHPRFAGEPIPTLADVLAIIPPDKRLLIEIKSGPEIVPELTRVLAAAPLAPSQTPLISFDLDALRAARRDLPGRKLFWIVELERDEPTGVWRPSSEQLIRTTLEAGMDGLDLGPAPEIDEKYTVPLRQAGLELYVWTVNTLDAARRFARLSFNGITTDRPGWLRAQLGSK